MITSKELAALLSGVSVEEVAAEAKVSTKTIYRLRNQSNSPRLDTVEKIVTAARRVASRRKPRAKAAA